MCFGDCLWATPLNFEPGLVDESQVIEAVNAKKAAEAAEHTFQPIINERSKAIFRPLL